MSTVVGDDVLAFHEQPALFAGEVRQIGFLASDASVSDDGDLPAHGARALQAAVFGFCDVRGAFGIL